MTNTGGGTLPQPPDRCSPAAMRGQHVDSSGATTTNIPSPSGSPVGPWLKDVPANGTHYTISVANDGTGAITVTPAGTAANPCAAAT